MTTEEKYELLWVRPAAGAVRVPSVNELEEALGGLYAHVIPSTSLERQNQRQTAVRLFGLADKATVLRALETNNYTVVDSERRPIHANDGDDDWFAFTDW